MIKKYLKYYGLLIGIIIILTLIISIINYFINIPINTFKIIIPIISMFISCLFLGKSSKEKAYLEGIKFSLIYIIITIILKLLVKTTFNCNYVYCFNSCKYNWFNIRYKY